MSAHPGPLEGTAIAPVARGSVSRESRALRTTSLASARVRLRRRAILDAVLLGMVVAAVPAFLADPLDSLLAGIAAAGLAIVIFLARRSSDLVAYAREARARSRHFESAGVPLADWHAGAPVAPWAEREAACERVA